MKKEIKYQDINAKTIDRWVQDGWKWGIPISHADFLAAQQGKISMVLTPLKSVPQNWLPTNIKGKKILGLASGGGQQMPLLAALGAEIVVFDNSQAQLDREQEVADREGYPVTLIKGDMSKSLPFPDNYFDLIIHPVSDVYIRSLDPLLKECSRILKKGGRLLYGFDNSLNFLFDEDETKIVNSLPFDPLENDEYMHQLEKSDGGVEFSHSLEETLGGLLKNGFRLRDLYEDTNDEGFLKEKNVACFMAVLATKEED